MPKLVRNDTYEQFHQEYPECWLCKLLGIKQVGKTELHHISGRGNQHDVRENYAALCTRHHMLMQSQTDAEVLCLVLKHKYDPKHCNRELLCELRHKADSWITEFDLDRAIRLVRMLHEAM